MDVNTLNLFAEALRKGSFAAVARDRGVAPSSVSRAIAHLEHELGVALLERTTRSMRPTEAGRLFYDRIEPLVAELDQARSLTHAQGKQLQGTLRIAAPESFGRMNLVPLLPRFAADHPRLSIDLLLGDTVPSLESGGLDAALRIGNLTPTTDRMEKLTALTSVICAAPAYLEKHGSPQQPQDLSSHNCLFHGRDSRVWTFFSPEGERMRLEVKGRYTVSSAQALTQMAVSAMGIALLPLWSAAQPLRQGRLIRLLAHFRVEDDRHGTAVWLLRPVQDWTPRKTSLFRNYLIEQFKAGAPSELGSSYPPAND